GKCFCGCGRGLARQSSERRNTRITTLRPVNNDGQHHHAGDKCRQRDRERGGPWILPAPHYGLSLPRRITAQPPPVVIFPGRTMPHTPTCQLERFTDARSTL